ncbi:hypothetical protein TCAL_16787 [Tigriopus californicus]|uniref:Spaetzle domain-containing protein n=1 Tax=Tigriopus californicus TaxID=6832 RepID=A0A553PRX4_TIGCA|nr:hypothetical protein TCAL_16787 [Tigriopus californicus]
MRKSRFYNLALIFFFQDGDNPQQGRSIGDSKTRWLPGQREHGNDFEAIEAELSEILFGSTEEETIESEEQADEDLGADHDNDDDNGMVKINAKARIPIRKRIGTNKPGGRRRKRPLQDIRPSDVTPIALQPDSDIIDGDRGEFKDYDYKNYDLYAYDEDSQEEEEEEKPTPEEVLSDSNATLTMSPQASEIRASRPFPMGGKRRRNPFGPHLPIGLPGLAPNGKIIRGRNRPYIPLSNSPSLTLGENSKIFPRRRPKFGPKPNGRQQLGRKSNRPNHLAAGPSSCIPVLHVESNLNLDTMSDTIENPFKDEMRLNPTLSFLEDKELHELKGTLTSRDRPLPGKGKRDRLPGRNLGPGPLKRKNHNSNNNNIRPSAVKSQRSYQISQSGDCNHYTDDLCLDANNYPSEQILGLLDRNRRIGADLVADVIDQSADNLIDGVTSAQENSYTFTHYFGENRRQDGVEQKHRDFAEEGGFLCPSEIMYAKPKRGKTAQGTWKDIVNVKDYTQTLRMEKCLKPGGGCSYVSHHYKSQCSQVYNYHRLLSWDKERGLHMDIYKVPTCCSCHIMGYSYVYPPLKSSQGGLQKPAFNNQNSNGFSPSIPEFGGPSGGFTESKNVGFVDNSNKDFTAFMNTVSSKFPDDNGPDFGLSEQPSNLRSEAVAPPTNSVSSRTNKPRELSKPPGNTVRRRISSVRRRLDRDRKPMAHSQPEDEDEFKVRAKEANNFQARAEPTESESDDETSKTDESGGETKSVNYGYHPIIDFFDRYRWSAASR